MRYEIETTLIFDKWLSKQKDRQAVEAIAMRIARAEEGNLGDAEPVGGGVSEMRILLVRDIAFILRYEVWRWCFC